MAKHLHSQHDLQNAYWIAASLKFSFSVVTFRFVVMLDLQIFNRPSYIARKVKYIILLVYSLFIQGLLLHHLPHLF